MKSFRLFLRRLRKDQGFRHDVAFTVAVTVWGLLIVAAGWWGISSGGSPPSL